MEGYTSCNVIISTVMFEETVVHIMTLQTFNQATLDFYNSTLFQQVAQENADFLAQLPPFLDGRPVTLQNMVSKTFMIQFFSC